MSQAIPIKTWAAGQARRNNSKKGDAFEARVVQFLLARGFYVDQTKINRRMIFRKGRSAWITTRADFFGCIDIIAVPTVGHLVGLIQATSAGKMVGEKKRDLDASFPKQVNGATLEIWTPGVALNDFKIDVRIHPGQWFHIESAISHFGK